MELLSDLWKNAHLRPAFWIIEKSRKAASSAKGFAAESLANRVRVLLAPLLVQTQKKPVFLLGLYGLSALLYSVYGSVNTLTSNGAMPDADRLINTKLTTYVQEFSANNLT